MVHLRTSGDEKPLIGARRSLTSSFFTLRPSVQRTDVQNTAKDYDVCFRQNMIDDSAISFTSALLTYYFTRFQHLKEIFFAEIFAATTDDIPLLHRVLLAHLLACL